MAGERHRGVNETDPRNQGVIEYFRPREVTADYARAKLATVNRDPIQVEESVARLMAKLASKPPRPSPPLSWTLAQSPDPHFSTHPDIVEQLWGLDRALPESCRWLVWGYPALVHPRTGVVFAVAFGTIGIVVRLPPDRIDRAALATRQNGSDITAAGPEWRFLGGSEEALCRAAHDFAAVEAEDGLGL